MDIPNGLLGKIIGGGKSDDATVATKDSSSAKDTNLNVSTNSAATDPIRETETTTSTTTNNSASGVTIDSKTNIPVEHEVVDRTHEEKVQEVIEREKHQDHYHTTIQPLKEKEVEPEQHRFKETDTQKRDYNYDDAAKTKAKLDAENPDLGNTSTTGITTATKTEEKSVTDNEHVHHHYHETVQPVIEKETVVPTVTHTKVPVHEKYQEESVVHSTTTAEPMSKEEFEKVGTTVNKSS